MEIEGQWVHFQIRDAFHPDPAELLHSIFGAHLLQGRVVAITSGHDAGDYAVVAVESLDDPVVVPVSKTQLSLVETSEP